MVDRPQRIQRKRTKGWKMPPNTVVVDRSSGFGNPFSITKGTSTHMGVTTETWCIGTWSGPGMWFRDTPAEARELAVSAYRAWINHPAQSNLRDKARLALAGKNLACWCKPGDACHADVLLELANGPALGRADG
ncbi:MAG: DUF4326 domain-containing protein [Alphaproteobacteria bacterium]|nr:DUF4326 domain-containing protein [Alphaproteobacteria bacterium]MCW5739626.1 DUF4326 domain-containing protein [Alphaproteobacteria bacterium]